VEHRASNSLSHQTVVMHANIKVKMAYMLRAIIESLHTDDAPLIETLLSIADPDFTVFSYNKLPTILIKLIVSSPTSDTDACPNDWSSTTPKARFAQHS
jgi:hypothetical protein